MRPSFYTAMPQPEVAVPFDDVAPVEGMDTTVPIHNMRAGVAVFLYNMIPSEYGCETREGYQVWAQNLAGGKVKTLIPFIGEEGNFSLARLFACTSTGIFDVTGLGTDNPVAEVTFADQTDAAGYGVYIHFTDPNGDQVLLAAISGNGLYEYDPSGTVWTKITTEITFPDSTTPSDIEFIMTHKNRIWMIPKDSADAYYLPVGAKAGTATKFQFGAKLQNGGDLVGLWNWSVDGGAGLDDYLIAQARGGDIIIYQGTDPAQADKWSSVGIWFVGIPPNQRRIALGVGGDTVLLAGTGLVSAHNLLMGIDPTQVERNITAKISPLLRDAIREKGDCDCWQITMAPEESLLVINSPRGEGERHIQFVLNLNRLSEDQGGGWGLWRDVPAVHFVSYLKKVYFGTEDGRVCVMQGSQDNVSIAGDDAAASPVEFSALTRFSHFDAPGMYKQVHFIRPQFISNTPVKVACRAAYDYNLAEPNLSLEVNLPTGALWDSAKWDQAVWSGTFSSKNLSGGAGYGIQAAVYVQGTTSTRATWTNTSGTFQRWKFL